MKLDSYMPFTTAAVVIACVVIACVVIAVVVIVAVVIVAVVIACVVPVDAKPDERLIGAWLLSSFAS